MLTVLADDITGAAEIAGVCLRYGLSITFDFNFNIQCLPTTNVWIIASDVRSLSEKEACDVVRKIAVRLNELQVKTVFKKIDSVLRGHIVPEIKSLQEYIPIEKVFILPANPENGRIIRNGNYYINKKPLYQTAFAHDPDFPVKTTSVREILQLSTDNTQWLTPDIISQKDYMNYSLQIKDKILPVGGSAFFEACLPVYFPGINPASTAQKQLSLRKNILMICGSTHDNSQCFIRNDRQFRKIEIPRRKVKDYLYTNQFESFANHAALGFDSHKKLLLSVENGEESVAASTEVKLMLAKLTQALLNLCPIEELMIEGGATAYACLQATDSSSLIPVEEYARGIVRLKISGKDKLFLTIKPGSYKWPDKMFQV